MLIFKICTKYKGVSKQLLPSIKVSNPNNDLCTQLKALIVKATMKVSEAISSVLLI